jgi:hypothetical protein
MNNYLQIGRLAAFIAGVGLVYQIVLITRHSLLSAAILGVCVSLLSVVSIVALVISKEQ